MIFSLTHFCIQPHEQALRALVRFFNTKHYGVYAPLLHRRSSSQTGPTSDFHAAPPLSPGGGPGEELFPPTRTMNSFDVETSFRSSYGHEQSDELGDYELDDLLCPRYQIDRDGELETDPVSSRLAWDRLGDILGHYDDISDSESVGSVGFMRFGRSSSGSDGSVSDLDMDDEEDERKVRGDWEHIRFVHQSHLFDLITHMSDSTVLILLLHWKKNEMLFHLDLLVVLEIDDLVLDQSLQHYDQF